MLRRMAEVGLTHLSLFGNEDENDAPSTCGTILSAYVKQMLPRWAFGMIIHR